MTNDVFQTLLSDCLLAIVLFALFLYVARLSRSLHGIATWGAAHLVYTFGATLLDAVAPALASAGHEPASRLVLNIGAMLACAGMTGLAWSIVQFAQQRTLRAREIMLMPVAIALSAVAWILDGTLAGQGIALSLVEVVALGVMVWHLRVLRAPPGRLPAQMMIVGCAMLILLYGSAMPGWAFGKFGLDDVWVSADLSIWFMLNFCMLMLTSFRAAESLRQSAMSDPLTGALNRRGLEAELRNRLEGAAVDDGMAVIALDLDRFKSINDRYGHENGDHVLQRFGETVRECLRNDELFARVGGDEFAIVVAGARAASAPHLAEQVRARIAALQFAPATPALRITASLGVCVSATRDALQPLMRRADEALYAAKRNGRDRVELHTGA